MTSKFHNQEILTSNYESQLQHNAVMITFFFKQKQLFCPSFMCFVQLGCLLAKIINPAGQVLSGRLYLNA